MRLKNRVAPSTSSVGTRLMAGGNALSLAAVAMSAFVTFTGMAAPARADGLADWRGLWAGTCRTARPGGPTQAFSTSLNVRPLSADGKRYSWTLTYGAAGGRERQVRSYEIVAVDPARGRYLVDEKNGLKLDAYMVANQIFMPFAIGQVLIAAKYVRMKQGIVMELPTFPVQPSRQTCLTANPETCARSFALRSLQLCFLRRSR